MKVYRYMSQTEFNRFLCGEDIIGKDYFSARTNSTGVCFLSEVVKGISDFGVDEEYTPVQAYQFLYGVVSGDVLVEFEAPVEIFRQSFGIYAHAPWYDCDMTVKELCIPYYNRELCKPLRYSIPDSSLNMDSPEPPWFKC